MECTLEDSNEYDGATIIRTTQFQIHQGNLCCMVDIILPEALAVHIILLQGMFYCLCRGIEHVYKPI